MEKIPVAAITGASRGIGRAVAVELASCGFHIVGVSRNILSDSFASQLEELHKEIEKYGVWFIPLSADIADLNSHKSIAGLILDKIGRIDLLVNNAGVAPPQRLDILDETPENFDAVLDVNLKGAFFFTQVIAKRMIEQKTKRPQTRPKIVFVTSISAETVSINRMSYCISKAGLSMMAKGFAARLAEPGIGVYEIRPGIIATDMTEPAKEKYDKLINEGLIPQNRWGTPLDVAKAVSAIAQGRFDYSTGIVVEVSGGMGLKVL